MLLGIVAELAMAARNRSFFGSLEARDPSGLWRAGAPSPTIVLATAAIEVGVVLSRETIQVRWRKWLTGGLSIAR